MLTVINGAHDDSFEAAGHEGACGVAVRCGPEALEALYRRVQEEADARRPSEQRPAYDAVIGLDGCAPLDVHTMAEYVWDKASLKPFGEAFEEPVILARFDTMFAQFDHIGTEGQHLRITLPGGVRILCWNQAGEEENSPDAQPSSVMEILGTINMNTYKQTTSYQMEGTVVW